MSIIISYIFFIKIVWKFFFFLLREEILGGGEVGWRGAPVTAGAWRLRAVATPALGIPRLARGGKLSQTSDRLYSCGFPDRQNCPSSATGAGGF